MRRIAGPAWLAALAVACGAGDPPRAVGTLERERVALVAESAEPLVELAVREGDLVEAGDLVARLDPARFDARVARAESARDLAAARLAELTRGPRIERISEARARLAGAQGVLDTARQDLERAKELEAKAVASPSRLDRARASFDEALAQRDAAHANLTALLEGTTPEELDQAEAALAESEAALREARLRAARLELRAPVAGRIDALPFEIGERPPRGSTVAVLLEGAAPFARVYVPAELRTRVAAGDAARVHVDGEDGAYAGRVRNVASEASFTPYFALTERDRGHLVYVAEIDLIEDAARELPTGLPVEVELGL